MAILWAEWIATRCLEPTRPRAAVITLGAEHLQRLRVSQAGAEVHRQACNIWYASASALFLDADAMTAYSSRLASELLP